MPKPTFAGALRPGELLAVEDAGEVEDETVGVVLAVGSSVVAADESGDVG